MINYYHKKTEGVRITLKLPKNLDEYARNFLAIFNNAREYPERLLKVENSYDERVFVTVPKRRVDGCKEFLLQFGEIVEEYPVNVFTIKADYDNKGLDVLWEQRGDEDIEPEFIINIE